MPLSRLRSRIVLSPTGFWRFGSRLAVFGQGLDPRKLTFGGYFQHDFNRLAAYETVLGIALIARRTVDKQGDRLAAVGAYDGCFFQHDRGAQTYGNSGARIVSRKRQPRSVARRRCASNDIRP